MDFMKSVPDKFYDLAIVDPPYGIGDDGRKHKGRIFRKDGTHILKKDPRNGNVIRIKAQKYKLDSGYDNSQPEQSYFNELLRVSKHQIIWGENYMDFNQKSTSSGRIVWDKVNGESDQSDCEIAWTSKHISVRIFSYMWSGMLQGRSAIEGKISQGNRLLCEKRIHPNHKPTVLYKWLIKNYAKEGDKILDTHGGSLSIAIACGEMGFDLDACELDPDYFRDSVARVKLHFTQSNAFIRTPEILINPI